MERQNLKTHLTIGILVYDTLSNVTSIIFLQQFYNKALVSTC